MAKLPVVPNLDPNAPDPEPEGPVPTIPAPAESTALPMPLPVPAPDPGAAPAIPAPADQPPSQQPPAAEPAIGEGAAGAGFAAGVDDSLFGDETLVAKTPHFDGFGAAGDPPEVPEPEPPAVASVVAPAPAAQLDPEPAGSASAPTPATPTPDIGDSFEEVLSQSTDHTLKLVRVEEAIDNVTDLLSDTREEMHAGIAELRSLIQSLQATQAATAPNPEHAVGPRIDDLDAYARHGIGMLKTRTLVLVIVQVLVLAGVGAGLYLAQDNKPVAGPARKGAKVSGMPTPRSGLPSAYTDLPAESNTPDPPKKKKKRKRR